MFGDASRGVQSGPALAASQVEKLLYEGNWTPSPGGRTGLDTPARQSSIKVKGTLKLHENVSEGFVRGSE